MARRCLDHPGFWLDGASVSFAGVLIGLAPFLFSLGQLVRLSRMEKAKKQASKGKHLATSC